MRSMHSPDWWRRHWERSGMVDIEVADILPDGWQLWRDWHQIIAPDNHAEIEALEKDRGRYLGYGRVIARRRDVPIEEPLVSVPTQYTKAKLLRTP
jgi:hypothetical protein